MTEEDDRLTGDDPIEASVVEYMDGMPTARKDSVCVLDEDDNEVYLPDDECGTVPKRQKLLFLWEYLTLRGLFRLLGRQVGAQPFAFIAVACILSLNSLGMYKIHLKDRIRDGYTPINAPSRYETDVIRQFWNSSGDPMMTLLIMLAKDGGSMHRKEQLDEAARVIHFFNSNFTVDFEGEPLVFDKMCDPYCGTNTVFDMFKSSYDKQYALAARGANLSSTVKLNFPVASFDGYDVHLERSLFGVKTRPPGVPVPQDAGIEQRITNMEYAKVVLMIFRGDKGTERLERQMATWELAAYDHALEKYKSDLLDIMIVGTDVLDREMIRDGSRMTPFFAAGFGIMITFVSACVLATALFYDEMDPGKILIACVATLCPILAIASSYGIVSFLGCRVNSFMLVMPFLIMGIGVDDAFLMTHSWQRMSRQGYGVVERLGMVYEEVGPSITITSLTNFLSFGIGAFTPTPEIRLFCLVTAIAMAIVFILQLVLFGPILAIACRFEKKKAGDAWEHRAGWRKTVEEWFERILSMYCRLIGHRLFTLCIVAATVVYWYFGIIGLMNIQTRLDAVKILPRDSPIQKPNQILTDIVWAEYHPVTILVNNPFNISDKKQVGRFIEMVDEFENLHYSKGPPSSLNWLRDYANFYMHGEPIDLMASLWSGKLEVEHHDPVNPLQVNLTYAKLDSFLQSPFYKHWKSFLRVGHTPTGDEVVYNRWRRLSNVAARPALCTPDSRSVLDQRCLREHLDLGGAHRADGGVESHRWKIQRPECVGVGAQRDVRRPNAQSEGRRSSDDTPDAAVHGGCVRDLHSESLLRHHCQHRDRIDLVGCIGFPVVVGLRPRPGCDGGRPNVHRNERRLHRTRQLPLPVDQSQGDPQREGGQGARERRTQQTASYSPRGWLANVPSRREHNHLHSTSAVPPVLLYLSLRRYDLPGGLMGLAAWTDCSAVVPRLSARLPHQRELLPNVPVDELGEELQICRRAEGRGRCSHEREDPRCVKPRPL